MKINMKLICASLTLLSLPALANIDYKLAPGVIHTSLSSSGVYKIAVVNEANTPATFTINPLFYPVGGGQIGPFQNDKAIGDAGQFNLVPYLQVSPENLRVGANQGRSIRIFAKVPGNLTPGTYRANIEFALQQPASALPSMTSAKTVSTEVTVLINEVATIYANIGNGNAQAAKVTCRDLGNGQLQLDIYNNTNWLFDSNIQVVAGNNDANASQAGILPVMPQSEGLRQVAVTTNATGPYSVKWQLKNVSDAPWTTVSCSK